MGSPTLRARGGVEVLQEQLEAPHLVDDALQVGLFSVWAR